MNHCCVKSGDTMRVSATPLPEMPAALKQLFEAAPQPVGAKA